MAADTRADDPAPIVVTGASRGIGRAVAVGLAQAGHPVIAWARSADRLAELQQCGMSRISTCVVDVRYEESVRDGVERSLNGREAIRGVVVNAGMGEWGPVSDMPFHVWRTMMETNLDGAFHTLKQLRPFLVRRPGAQVVTMISDSALYAYPQRAAYCASKAGLRGLVDAFRREVRPRHTRVTSLYPGRVDTYFRNGQPGSRSTALRAEDVASVVTFLFAQPEHVEIRDLSLCSMFSPYGPYDEVAREGGLTQDERLT